MNVGDRPGGDVHLDDPAGAAAPLVMLRADDGSMSLVERGLRRPVRSRLLAEAIVRALALEVRPASDVDRDAHGDGPPVEVFEADDGLPFVVVDGLRLPVDGLPLPHPVQGALAAGLPVGPVVDLGELAPRRDGKAVQWLAELGVHGSDPAPVLVRTEDGTAHVLESGVRRPVRSRLLAEMLADLLGAPRRLSASETAITPTGPPVELYEAPTGAPFVVLGGRRFRVRRLPLPIPVPASVLASVPPGGELDAAVLWRRGSASTPTGGSATPGPDPDLDDDRRVLRRLMATRGRPGPDLGQLRLGCFFIGYDRSGHSLVASLLDAHPRAVIAHESGVFRRRGPQVLPTPMFPDRRSMVDWLVHLSGQQAAHGRRGQRLTADGTPAKVRYVVEGQWQGRVEALEVVGDKRGKELAQVSRRSTVGLRWLQDLLEVPLQLVHVVRDPAANVAALAAAGDRDPVRSYFDLADGVEAARAGGFTVHDVHIEDLLVDPEGVMAALLEVLGLGATPDHLAACARCVAAGAPLTRRPLEPSVEREVRARAADLPWLVRYR